MTILISAQHIGYALRQARRSLYCDEANIAEILGVSERIIQQYERGLAVPSGEQLQQIFTMGIMMMRARKLQHEFCNLYAERRKNQTA